MQVLLVPAKLNRAAGGSKLYLVLSKTGGERMPPPPATAAFTQAQKDIIYQMDFTGAKKYL